MEPSPRPDELRALSRLAGRRAGRRRRRHRRASTTRSRSACSARSARRPLPVRHTHDAIARGVYASLQGAGALAGLAAGEVLSRRAGGDGRPLSTTPRGARRRSPSSTGSTATRSRPRRPTCRSRWPCARTGASSRPSPAPSRAAFPAASGRLVVFLHGLMETEHAWRLGGRPSYGERLAEDLGSTRARRPLQLGPPRLAERALAGRAARGARRRLARAGGGDRARRPLDGRARRPQRRPPGRRGRARLGRARPPRRLARHAAPGRAARAGRALRRARAPRGPRDAPARRASCAGAAPASATCARARSSTATGRAATRTRCAPRRARRCRCSTGRHALLRDGHDHARPGPSGRAPARRRARADVQRRGPRPHAPDPVPRGGRPARRRRAPPRAAQPPGGLRAAARVARAPDAG